MINKFVSTTGSTALHTFSVSLNAEELNCDQNNQKHGDPYTSIQVISPVFDRHTCSRKLEWKHYKPGDSIVPTDSKAPIV